MWDWTVKKAESWRIDAFELWCWRRLLRVPWAARRSNQSILKEVSPGISLEGMMLKLKLQHFGHLMRRVDSLEKTLMLGGIGAGGEGDDRGWDGWMASLTRWTWVSVNSGSWWWTGRPGVLWFMGSQSRTRLSDWSDWSDLMDNKICLLVKRFPTCAAFILLLYVSYVKEDVSSWWRLCHIQCICEVSCLCEFSDASSALTSLQRLCHIVCLGTVSCLYGFWSV